MRMKQLVILFVMTITCHRTVIAMTIPQRIITLGSAITETADALGLGSNIVATDVTSEYPAYIKKLPKVSRNRSLSLEGILMFRPDIILAPENEVPKNMQAQLKKAGISLVIIRQEYSSKGAARFITDIAEALQVKEKGKTLILQLEQQLKTLQSASAASSGKPKVLFIYARGTGMMSVAGKGSNMDALISLSGGTNAVQEFSDFKTYSTEALISANPDVILLFDFGASSLGGKSSILKMPGVMLTNAGKQKRIIEIDGPLAINFSSRLPEAINDLRQKLFP
jgi:iron complex transport system substrate-binding protein